MWTDVSSLVSWSFAVRFWFCCIAELSAWAGISLVSMVVWFYLSSTDQRLQFCSTIFSGLRRSTFNDRRMEEFKIFPCFDAFLIGFNFNMKTLPSVKIYLFDAFFIGFNFNVKTLSSVKIYLFDAFFIGFNFNVKTLSSVKIYLFDAFLFYGYNGNVKPLPSVKPDLHCHSLFFFPLWCNWQTFFFNPVIR